MAAFGVAALALALTGIYAVIAYSISQRAREIGIRIALGARRSNIVRLVMGESGRFIALGLAAGVAAALFVMRLGSAMLFGVAASDPAILTEVTAVVAALSAIASAIPALRCQSRALCDSSTSTSPLRSAPGS